MNKTGKKKRNKRLTKKQQCELEEKIRELIGRSYSDFEVEEKLNLQPHVLRHYKKRIHDKDKVAFANLTPEMVLADFAEKSKDCISELEEVIQEGRKTGKMSHAQVQAIKLQHNLWEAVLYY